MKFIRQQIVCDKTGRSRADIYKKMSEGLFPRQVSLGGKRAVAWVESEIDDWMKALIKGANTEDLKTLVSNQLLNRQQLI